MTEKTKQKILRYVNCPHCEVGTQYNLLELFGHVIECEYCGEFFHLFWSVQTTTKKLYHEDRVRSIDYPSPQDED